MGERELPEGWEWKRLEDVGKIISGVTYKSEEASDEPQENYIPILRAMNINGELNFNDLVFVPLERVNKEQFIRADDIVIAMSSGSKAIVGKTAQAKEDFHGSFGAFCAGFRCNEDIDKKYVGFFFQTPYYRALISHLSRGANINNLRKENFKSMLIPLPPLPIQRHIVAVLELAEAVKRQRQEADALTRALLQSVFFEMFGDPVQNERGWPIKTLRELSHKITDGKHGDCTDLENSGYFFISAKDIINGKIDYSNSRQITKEDYLETNKRLNFEMGDIILTNSGSFASIAKTAIAEDIEKTPRTTFQKSVAIIKSNKKIVDSTFFVSVLKLNKSELYRKASGSSQKNLLIKDISNFKIPLPPLELQQQFAHVIESLERIRDQQVASGRQIEGLCEGLMQRAFAGELSKGNF